jgi:hypothetical protein
MQKPSRIKLLKKLILKIVQKIKKKNHIKMNSQLDIIKKTLAEFGDVCCDQDLLAAEKVIYQMSKSLEFNVDNLVNYKEGSQSLSEDNPDCEKSFLLLLIARQSLLKKEFHFSDILFLNSLILGTQPQLRKENLDDSYPFPDPEYLDEGMTLIENFLDKNDPYEKPLFKKIAAAQALLSLHPFNDGNHRTVRLILDFWLSEMNLPTLFINSNKDLLIANPYTQQVFSLKHAITQVLFAMESGCSAAAQSF